MYMTIEGMPGTGVDEDESDAIAVAHWRWGMYEGTREFAGNQEVYDLTVIRELDPASQSIERMCLNRTGCSNISLYDYTGAGLAKVKATVLALKQARIVYYTAMSFKDQEPLEIFGLRFTEATVRYPPGG
jgi:type VI protein secretion system component Hcp